MSAPCGNRKRGHRHSLSYLTSGPPTRLGPRRTMFSDRCNSGLLWCSVARAVLLDNDPLLDGKPFTRWTKQQAWTYLLTMPPATRRAWSRGITPPEES